jgi:hypothetical protein
LTTDHQPLGSWPVFVVTNKLKNPVWTVQREERQSATNGDQEALISAFPGNCYGNVRLAGESAKGNPDITT